MYVKKRNEKDFGEIICPVLLPRFLPKIFLEILLKFVLKYILLQQYFKINISKMNKINVFLYIIFVRLSYYAST